MLIRMKVAGALLDELFAHTDEGALQFYLCGLCLKTSFLIMERTRTESVG